MTFAKVIPGSMFVDDRGVMLFNNSLPLDGTKRSYFVYGDKGMIRAWHGHKLETKVIQCTSGRVRVCAINMELGILDEVNSFYLIPNGNAVLIPKEHYNGIQFLADNSAIIVYSNTTLEESKNDDYRLDWDKFGTSFWNMEAYR
jgi:dTDP-4-dehydrorhamnose 3,5-epimerase-like enzyme